MYTSNLLRYIPRTADLVGVESREETLKSIAPEMGIYLVCEDALELSRQLDLSIRCC
jgi:hypothetical protein